MDRLTFTDLRNQSDHKFTDISSEEWREYYFPVGPGRDESYVKVQNPVALAVSASGGHRLLTAVGNCIYVPPGWTAIRWKVQEGQPHFVK